MLVVLGYSQTENKWYAVVNPHEKRKGSAAKLLKECQSKYSDCHIAFDGSSQ